MLDTQEQTGGYLEGALSDACDAQQIRLQDLINDNSGRTSANDDEKTSMYATWFMLEGSNYNFANAGEF